MPCLIARQNVVSSPHLRQQLTRVDWFRAFCRRTAHAHLVATEVRLDFQSGGGLLTTKKISIRSLIIIRLESERC